MVGSVFAIPQETNGLTRLVDAPRNPSRTLPLRQFIAGPENLLLTQVVQSLTSDWGQFNPVFLCGETGVGKTHLTHCLVQCAQQSWPQLSKLILSGTDYARSVLHAIEVDSLDELRERHRSVDLFVLDGLQEIAGKPLVQQELSRTIDVLRELNAMLIVTSQFAVQEMHTAEPMLASRLASGLRVTLAFPEPEARREILHAISRQYEIPVPEHVFARFAETTGRQIDRFSFTELRAALLQERQADKLGDQGAETASQPSKEPGTPKQIKRQVAKYFRIRLRDLTSTNRQRKVVRARITAAYLLRTIHGLSFGEIGRELGGRDHSTIMHAVRRASTFLEEDSEFKLAVRNLRATLG